MRDVGTGGRDPWPATRERRGGGSGPVASSAGRRREWRDGECSFIFWILSEVSTGALRKQLPVGTDVVQKWARTSTTWPKTSHNLYFSARTNRTAVRSLVRTEGAGAKGRDSVCCSSPRRNG